MVCAGRTRFTFRRPFFWRSGVLLLDNAWIHISYPFFIRPPYDPPVDAVSMYVSDRGWLCVHGGEVNGGSHGIVVDQGGEASLTETNFDAVGDTAVEVRGEGARLALVKCDIDGGYCNNTPTSTGKFLGMRVHQFARAEVNDCKFSACSTCCVWVDRGFVKLTKTLLECSPLVLYAARDSHVQVLECWVFENERDLWEMTGAIVEGEFYVSPPLLEQRCYSFE